MSGSDRHFLFVLGAQIVVATVLAWVSFELRSRGVLVVALGSMFITILSSHASYNLARRIEREAPDEEVTRARQSRSAAANVAAILLLLGAIIGAFA